MFERICDRINTIVNLPPYLYRKIISMTTLLTSIPLKTSFNQIGPVGELFGINWKVYFVVAIIVSVTLIIITFRSLSMGLMFVTAPLSALALAFPVYVYFNNYYNVSGTLQSVSDYRSHQVVVFNDAKAFYTESGTDLSKSAGKQVTLTCRGRIGDRVSDTDLCRIDSVK